MLQTKKTLIDSVYINNGGGKLILLELIDYVIENKKSDSFYFLFDKRLDIENKEIFNKINFKYLKNNEISRRLFYRQNINNFQKFVCLSNVPPPFTIKKPVYIYFHNSILLNPIKLELSLKDRIVYYIKKQYIKLKNNKAYLWITQTNLMKKNLVKFYNINSKSIKIFPIFNESKSNVLKKNQNTFLYIANNSKHKNHKRLLYAFIEYSTNHKFPIELNLTLSKSEFINSPYSNKKYPKNLTIINHGILSHKCIIDLLKQKKHLIYPSIIESFGLPLIEAVNNNCIVLASKLDYVDEIITPSIHFDPFSVKSISDSIKTAINNKECNKAILKIENKIASFVEYIS